MFPFVIGKAEKKFEGASWLSRIVVVPERVTGRDSRRAALEKGTGRAIVSL
jgi:hypothetical protein